MYSYNLNWIAHQTDIFWKIIFSIGFNTFDKKIIDKP